MRRITVVLMVAVVMLVAVAVPAMAQGEDKAARKAAKQAQKAQKAQKTDSAPKKSTPETGGTPLSSVVLLGGGALLVGTGLVALRVARR
jgi:LPXTG-motif cell wall-anchored protein